MTYGSAAGVAAYVPQFANASGRFDNVTTPRLEQVDEWRNHVSAMLDVAMATAGLPAPATAEAVTEMLDGFVNANVASLVRAANGQGRYAAQPATVDEIMLALSTAADAWVKSHASGIGSLSGITSAEGVGSRAGSRLPTRDDEYTRYRAGQSEYAPPLEVIP